MISSVKLEVLSDGKLICEKILTLPTTNGSIGYKYSAVYVRYKL